LLRATRILAAFLFLLVAAGDLAAQTVEKKPTSIVAVFLIENRGTALTADELAALTDFLSTKLGEQGHYQIIPSDEIRKRLVDEKQASYKSCYDQSCQIEIGRELAAQYTVSSRISKVGSICIITAGIYDLHQAATENTATAKGSCKTDDLLVGIEQIVAKLLGQEENPPDKIATQEPKPEIDPVLVKLESDSTYIRQPIPRTKGMGLACLWGLLLPGGGMFYIDETGWGVAYMLTAATAMALGVGFAVKESDIKYFAIGFGGGMAIDLAAIIHAMVWASAWQDPDIQRPVLENQAGFRPVVNVEPGRGYHPAVFVEVFSGRF